MGGGIKGLLNTIWNGRESEEPAVKMRDSPGPRGYMIGSNGNYSFVPRLLNSANMEENPWLNSAFFSCLRWMTETFSEAPMVVQKWNDSFERWDTIRDHPLSKVIRRPNNFYTSSALFAGALISRASSGNAYLLKRRNSDQVPIQLWYLPHRDVNIQYSALPGNDFIDKYRIGSEFSSYDREPHDIVHLRNMLDPNTGGRTGLSPIQGMAWEIKADQEGTMSTYNMLKHMGFMVPIFSPKGEDTEITPDGASTIIDSYTNKTTGENRGKPVILSDAMDVNIVQIKPTDMDTGSLRTSAMTRICGALGIDPLVIGLSGEQATYKNKAEAREASYEGAIIPVQRQFTEQFDAQLLPDFEESHWNFRTWFDISTVRILQKDLTDLSDRVSRLYMAKVVDRYEAKTMLRMDASSEDKGVYYEQSEDGQGDDLNKERKAPVAGSNQTKT